MPNFYSPEGNYEVWEEKPDGYYTDKEWIDLHPPEPPEPPTIEQLTEQFINLIQQRLDEFAQTRGYDNILSACTYVSSTVPLFQAEGQYCVEMRDATWMTAYGILGEVITGIRPIMSWTELKAELPALEWPVEGGENRG